MEIYLISSKHGKKIAYAELEAQLDKKNGWKEVSKDEYYGKKKKTKPKNRLNDGNSSGSN